MRMFISFITLNDFYFLVCNFAKFTCFEGTLQNTHFLTYDAERVLVTAAYLSPQPQVSWPHLASTCTLGQVLMWPSVQEQVAKVQAWAQGESGG